MIYPLRSPVAAKQRGGAYVYLLGCGMELELVHVRVGDPMQCTCCHMPSTHNQQAIVRYYAIAMPSQQLAREATCPRKPEAAGVCTLHAPY